MCWPVLSLGAAVYLEQRGKEVARFFLVITTGLAGRVRPGDTCNTPDGSDNVKHFRLDDLPLEDEPGLERLKGVPPSARAKSKGGQGDAGMELYEELRRGLRVMNRASCDYARNLPVADGEIAEALERLQSDYERAFAEGDRAAMLGLAKEAARLGDRLVALRNGGRIDA